jgi:hypothetical protein
MSPDGDRPAAAGANVSRFTSKAEPGSQDCITPHRVVQRSR